MRKRPGRCRAGLRAWRTPSTGWAPRSWRAPTIFRRGRAGTGRCSDSRTRATTATFDAKVCVFFVCASVYGFYNDTAGGSEVSFSDVNGDGLVDQIAKLDGDPKLYVKLNQLGA